MGLSSGAWHADNMHIRANMNNICAKGWQLCLWEISLALPSMGTWKEHSPPLHPRTAHRISLCTLLSNKCKSLARCLIHCGYCRRAQFPVAWLPRLSAGRRESGSQRPWLGEAAPQPEGSSVFAQKAPARLGVGWRKGVCPWVLVGRGRSCCQTLHRVAPHSWKIPRMEEPGRLQSMGWLRVGHH